MYHCTLPLAVYEGPSSSAFSSALGSVKQFVFFLILSLHIIVRFGVVVVFFFFGCTESSLCFEVYLVQNGFSFPAAHGQPGLKPASPELESKFLTTGPPRKSRVFLIAIFISAFFLEFVWCISSRFPLAFPSWLMTLNIFSCVRLSSLHPCGEVSAQVLCPVFNWVACFLAVEL